MQIELSNGNVLVEYIGKKKKGHTDAVVIQKNQYVNDITIGKIYMIDSEKATDITYNGSEMAIINSRFIKAEK